MARKQRAVAVGIPHHVTQRGNNRQPVFFHDRDREVYLEALFDYAAHYGMRVWGYCLMTNHVHFVVLPEQETSLARVIGRTHSDYARYANLLRRGCGHLWQGRFYSCPLDESVVWWVLAYIERNPLRAGLVADATHWLWSSAKAHCTGRDPTERLDLAAWRLHYTPDRWREALTTSIRDEALQERIREATVGGLPLGSAAFVDALSRMLGRDLHRRPPGHPRKDAARAASEMVQIVTVPN